MESSHLVIFSTSGKFITKFNILCCTLFWTGARGRIAITLMGQVLFQFFNTMAPVANIPVVIIPFTHAIMPLKACLLEVFYPYVSFIELENLLLAGPDVFLN